MARLDRAYYETALFPVVAMVATRIGDVDVQHHINNVAVIALLQEGRVALNKAARSAADFGKRLVVGGMSVEYAGELSYPEPVEVASGVLRVGRTSFVFAQRVRQFGLTAVYAEITMVLVDDSGPAVVPDAMRRSYEALSLKMEASNPEA